MASSGLQKIFSSIILLWVDMSQEIYKVLQCHAVACVRLVIIYVCRCLEIFLIPLNKVLDGSLLYSSQSSQLHLNQYMTHCFVLSPCPSYITEPTYQHNTLYNYWCSALTIFISISKGSTVNKGKGQKWGHQSAP